MLLNWRNELRVMLARSGEILSRVAMLVVAYAFSTFLVLDYQGEDVIFDLVDLFDADHPIAALRDIGVGIVAVAITNAAATVRELTFGSSYIKPLKSIILLIIAFQVVVLIAFGQIFGQMSGELIRGTKYLWQFMLCLQLTIIASVGTEALLPIARQGPISTSDPC